MKDIINIIFGNDSILPLFVSMLTILAITLIYKTSTTTNFSQTTIATTGCFIVAKILFESGMNVWVYNLIGLVICIVLGIFIDVGVIRRARHVNPVGKQIITMGFTYVLLTLIAGPLVLVYPDSGAKLEVNPATVFIPISSEHSVSIGGISYYWNTVICIGISVAILVAFFIAIYRTKWGLGVRMTASNETTAQMMGVNTHVITAASWSIAAGIGCLACVFLNNLPGKLNASIMTNIQLTAFLGCIVGGFTTFWGPLVAGIIMWFVGAIVNVLKLSVSSIDLWREVIMYVVAMILVLIRPTGLFGKAVRKKV